MKLSSLQMVVRANAVRAQLLADLEQVRHRNVSVLLAGVRQDETFAALISPPIERELRARLAECERDLEAMGVAIG